ncbi:hypothetical protein PPACK8108_LOCUS24736 [Phakopsora pachyrhizi]|uniref:BSD domain-containing protein n=1 Tax=Phakopsora pachyrhizi TaxID=170000 RepID=A0AAV0BTN6_PHAPC|nr:hypothetical protein PPACK8108_LOCUS24736 [Phakopsora pachyrhizi]
MSSNHEVPICLAGVTYRKKPGTLELFNNHLRWSQESRDKPDLGVDEVAIENYRLISLFTSKEGGAKVMIKIVASSKNFPSTENSKATGKDPQKTDENFLFTFINQVDAPKDWYRFKDEISSIIANNKSKIQDQDVLICHCCHWKSASDQTSISNNNQRSSSNNLVEGTGSVEDKSNGNNRATKTNTLQNWRLKKRVLQKNPDLRQLHKALVIGGQINKFDFWQGREGLLFDEARLESQTRGRSSKLVDPRPKTTNGGEITISITPQMISEIFEMFPVVQKAYNKNVPPLLEQNFWTRYFRSKLFD